MNFILIVTLFVVGYVGMVMHTKNTKHLEYVASRLQYSFKMIFQDAAVYTCSPFFFVEAYFLLHVFHIDLSFTKCVIYGSV